MESQNIKRAPWGAGQGVSEIADNIAARINDSGADAAAGAAWSRRCPVIPVGFPLIQATVAAGGDAAGAAIIELAAKERNAMSEPDGRVILRRRTPQERLDYLRGKRDEAIANGIPGAVIDAMIRDAERLVDGNVMRVWKMRPGARRLTWLQTKPWLWMCRICNLEASYPQRTLPEIYADALVHLEAEHGRGDA